MATTASNGDRSIRPIADIDIAAVAEALSDSSGETSWWYDPTGGQTELSVPDAYLIDDDENDDTYERGLIPIEPMGSRDAYRDMVAFAGSVADPRASELLLRALQGRGAFRRFRDTLDEFDELRAQWFTYSNAASEYRAIDWLLAERCVTTDDAAAEQSTRNNTIDTVLADIGAPRHDTVDEGDLIEQWEHIGNLIDTGRTITIERDGRPWATITSHHAPSETENRT